MLKQFVYYIIAMLFLAGCTETKIAEVVNLTKPKAHQKWEHIVSSGETLYMIAWGYGLDYKKIAEVNNIKEPYNITKGQTLNLNYSDANKKIQKKYSKKLVVKHYRKQHVKWIAPIKVKNKGEFKKKYSHSKYNKGLDILIPKGQNVLAASSGKVVYAGSGLKGYGKLIILKHEGDYLSAYAYNKSLNVKEGQEVKIGEKIAESGLRDDGLAMLHFQIRYQGKPVDPAKVIL